MIPAAARWRPGPPTMAALFSLGAAFVGLVAGIQPISDNSFITHVRNGELILDSGIPHEDVYSYTAAGTKWVAQSWLAEVVFALVDRLAGGFGLRVLTAAATVALFVGLFRLVLRLAVDRVRALLVTAAVAPPILIITSPRPLLYGLLCFLLLTWVVEVPDSWVGRRALLVIPPLIWVWANVHGSWTLGVGYVALHALGRCFDGEPLLAGRSRTLLAATGMGIVVSVVNPYFVDLLLFPVELLGRGEVLASVAEWRPPSLHRANGMAFGVTLVALVVSLGRTRATWRDLLVSVVFLLLGLWAIRNIAVAAIVAAPVIARAWRSDVPRPEAGQDRVAALVAGMLSLAGVFVVIGAARGDDYDLDHYSVAAFDHLAERGDLGANILHSDADGGYLIWRWWPQQRVFMDDRFDMYPVALQEDYARLLNLDEGWQEVLDKYGVEIVVWRTDGRLVRGLELATGWCNTWHDEDVTVFRRCPPIHRATDVRRDEGRDRTVAALSGGRPRPTQSAGPCTELPASSNLLLVFSPRNCTATRTTRAMNATRRMYSTMLAPRESRSPMWSLAVTHANSVGRCMCVDPWVDAR